MSPTRTLCVSPMTLLIGFFMLGRGNELLVPPLVPSSERTDSMSM